MTLEEIREVWPLARRAPDAGCDACGGTGTPHPQPLSHGARGGRPCMCLFVAREERGLVAEMVRELAARFGGTDE